VVENSHVCGVADPLSRNIVELPTLYPEITNFRTENKKIKWEHRYEQLVCHEPTFSLF
jgi:hypothetical protein